MTLVKIPNVLCCIVRIKFHSLIYKYHVVFVIYIEIMHCYIFIFVIEILYTNLYGLTNNPVFVKFR